MIDPELTKLTQNDPYQFFMLKGAYQVLQSKVTNTGQETNISNKAMMQEQS